MKTLLILLILGGGICAAHAIGVGRDGLGYSKLGASPKKGIVITQPTGDILMVDGTSLILQTDGASFVCRAGGC